MVHRDGGGEEGKRVSKQHFRTRHAPRLPAATRGALHVIQGRSGHGAWHSAHRGTKPLGKGMTHTGQKRYCTEGERACDCGLDAQVDARLERLATATARDGALAQNGGHGHDEEDEDDNDDHLDDEACVEGVR